MTPKINEPTNQDLGYVEVQWSDTGAAGLDAGTFDATDIVDTVGALSGNGDVLLGLGTLTIGGGDGNGGNGCRW